MTSPALLGNSPLGPSIRCLLQVGSQDASQLGFARWVSRPGLPFLGLGLAPPSLARVSFSSLLLRPQEEIPWVSPALSF